MTAITVGRHILERVEEGAHPFQSIDVVEAGAAYHLNTLFFELSSPQALSDAVGRDAGCHKVKPVLNRGNLTDVLFG